MPAYLKFYQLDKTPFESGVRGNLVLGTEALRSAFAEIERGLGEGAPRICLDGNAGMGKTSLARALPKLLGDDTRVVLLLNPALPWSTLRSAIVRQFDLENGVLSRKTLMRTAAAGCRLVLVVDQAELISQESLEHLDILLNYRSDEDKQLVHCVLLADLESPTRQGEHPLLWWLDSLTTLQVEFAPIPASGIGSYINKHLKRAGWSGNQLFTPDAMLAVHRLTGGVPRAVSELCERILAEAATRGLRQIGFDLVEDFCETQASGGDGGEADTGSAPQPTTAAAEPTHETGKSEETDDPAPDAASHDVSDANHAEPEETHSECSTSAATPLGLDAYFASGPRHTSVSPEEHLGEDAKDSPDEAEEHWDYEARTGRRRTGRWLTAAALVAALAAGGYSMLEGDSRETPASATSRRQSTDAKLARDVTKQRKKESNNVLAPVPTTAAKGDEPLSVAGPGTGARETNASPASQVNPPERESASKQAAVATAAGPATPTGQAGLTTASDSVGPAPPATTKTPAKAVQLSAAKKATTPQSKLEAEAPGNAAPATGSQDQERAPAAPADLGTGFRDPVKAAAGRRY